MPPPRQGFDYNQTVGPECLTWFTYTKEDLRWGTWKGAGDALHTSPSATRHCLKLTYWVCWDGMQHLSSRKW